MRCQLPVRRGINDAVADFGLFIPAINGSQRLHQPLVGVRNTPVSRRPGAHSHRIGNRQRQCHEGNHDHQSSRREPHSGSRMAMASRSGRWRLVQPSNWSRLRLGLSRSSSRPGPRPNTMAEITQEAASGLWPLESRSRGATPIASNRKDTAPNPNKPDSPRWSQTSDSIPRHVSWLSLRNRHATPPLPWTRQLSHL
jgi:hypothetical protein